MNTVKSILQKDEDRCFLCGMPENGDHLDWHHVFEGPRRKRSEEYGLTVRLHHRRCHQEGPKAVHRNSETMKQMKAKCQEEAMRYYGWSVEEWIKIFGKSYLQKAGRDTPVTNARRIYCTANTESV